MFQTTTREQFQDFPIANRPAAAAHPFSQLYFGTGCRVSAGAGDVLMSRSKINKSSVSEPNLAICLLKMDPHQKKTHAISPYSCGHCGGFTPESCNIKIQHQNSHINTHIIK